MKLHKIEHLPFFQALYSTYTITGPFVTPRNIPYFQMSLKQDLEAVFYMPYAYGLLVNVRRKLLRANQTVGFRDGTPTNYNKSNVKSIIIADRTAPLRGWGMFDSLEALSESQSAKYTIVDEALPVKLLRTRLAEAAIPPDSVKCAFCGKDLLLDRFQKNRYKYKGVREFVHSQCRRGFLGDLRKRGLRVRQNKSESRNEKQMVSLRLVHYLAKPALTYLEASSRDEAFFEAHYKDINKDYLVQRVIKNVVLEMPINASERTILLLLKKEFNFSEEIHTANVGSNFILFKRTIKGKGAPKEFIHASW